MRYRCTECGFETPKWMGFCPQCRSDSDLVEVADPKRGRSRPTPAGTVVPVSEVAASAAERRTTGLLEVDRVLGGGLVRGAAILLGGEPGVGKSTLLLQIAGGLAASGAGVLVASAEESLDQLALRAGRLGTDVGSVLVTSERDVDAIVAAGDERRPELLIVDSIQTVAAREVSGAPGGVAQVREAAARLVHFAKESGVAVVIVGHVTKDGSIAGPKLLEHTVDVVLYLEGDVDRGLRVLRSLKNRFGPANQVGLFEMASSGLVEVTDPAGMLLSGDAGAAAGSIVFPAMDGRRPLLVEVQALVAGSSLAQPRRSVKGLEAARLHQIIAVLERHGRLSFAGSDVYVSVVGGLRLRDPGADLAMALALASSLLDRPLGPVAAWGEVGLTGEVRAVPHADVRAAEAQRLGIERIHGPNGQGRARLADILAEAGVASSE
jgi:DNA repair protein RadA/Sms